MDLADILRKFDTSDENLKVAMVLGMRTFNCVRCEYQAGAFWLPSKQRTRPARRYGNGLPVGLVRWRPASHRALAIR